jgi:pimeloyl-ACP methyl ester carboxylesterase
LKKLLQFIFIIPVLFNATILLAGKPADTGSSLQKPFQNSHFLEVDSVMFHYRTWNDTVRRPKGKVVLIHGFCGSTFCFRKNYDTLAKSGYKVVAIDLPGFGYSARNARINQSQSNRARLIWELLKMIDQQDTTGWNIVGHSMGGGAAEAMALMEPERTRSLALVDGMVFIHNSELKGAFVTMSKTQPMKKILISFTKKSYFTYNNMSNKLKGVYGFRPDSSVVMGYLQPLLIDGTAESVVNILANAREITSLYADGLRKMPVLIIWGRNDRTIRLSTGKKLKRAVPTADLKIIPGARHMPMETHTSVFNNYLIGFLNSNN